MMYNNTKIEIQLPFHEGLFCDSTLAIDMWTENYYELLSIIGDDYEWTLNHSTMITSSRMLLCVGYITTVIRITNGMLSTKS